MSRLENKVAVITGGNSGIGLSTAQAFVEEGAKVVIFGRNQTTLDAAVETLGENAFGVQGDVTNDADLDALFDATTKRFGKVDILFANAGVAEFLPMSMRLQKQPSALSHGRSLLSWLIAAFVSTPSHLAQSLHLCLAVWVFPKK